MLARLCRSAPRGRGIKLSAAGRSGYILDEKVGLYVKYSTKRMSPWTFNFSNVHQAEIAELATQLAEVFIGLVCGTDGIVCLTHEEFRRVLDDDVRPSEWVRATRRRDEQYSVTGSDSVSIIKIADAEYPAKIYEALSRAQEA
ncbi:hypothetical protein [Ferrimicrobium sp.]|uniref:hypothetical protein n=1 Tax=Ferrimicrobium sp. TaxID=2926050 RepID=UPI00260F1DC7|nr:hypothetical protein [Ferrimicrobium sp.]